MKAAGVALIAALAAVPLAASAETAFVRNVPASDTWFPSVLVHVGTSIDIQLVDGDTLNSQAIVADPRWNMTSFSAGPRSTPHIILKPSGVLPEKQLLTIPGEKHDYHVLLRASRSASSAYTLRFYEPATSRSPSIATVATPAPKLATVESCSAPAPGTALHNAYRMTGDPRISVKSVCDDGTHTYIIMNPGRGPAVVPYKIDAGGRQDQLLNAVWAPELQEWVIAGVYDRLAVLADSSTGQIRVNLQREQ